MKWLEDLKQLYKDAQEGDEGLRFAFFQYTAAITIFVGFFLLVLICGKEFPNIKTNSSQR